MQSMTEYEDLEKRFYELELHFLSEIQSLNKQGKMLLDLIKNQHDIILTLQRRLDHADNKDQNDDETKGESR